MKKDILKKLINKALKEEKQLLNETQWCGCPHPSGGIVSTDVSTCPGGCSTCCDGGFICQQTESGCHSIQYDPADGPTRGPGRKKPTITNRQDTRKTRKGMPSVPTMPHGGGFGPGGIPTKPVNEAEMTVGDDNTAFKIKVDVSNKQSETKLGVRIQLTPKGGMLEPDVRDKVEIAITKKLNNALEQFDMQVSKDTDVPNPEVLGFFIPLSQIKNMIVKSIKGGSTPSPTGGASTPPTPPKPATPPAKPDTTNEMIEDMINKAIISEMRVRDLKEISKVVLKEDFYAFINAGNNVLRTLEEAGITERGKKYLEYLVKHNIM